MNETSVTIGKFLLSAMHTCNVMLADSMYTNIAVTLIEHFHIIELYVIANSVFLKGNFKIK